MSLHNFSILVRQIDRYRSQRKDVFNKINKNIFLKLYDYRKVVYEYSQLR